ITGLRRFGCPLVMLTATLPPQLERWFREQMLGKMALTVRDRTTKLICRYRVEQVKPRKGAVEQYTAEMARQLGQRMVGTQKGIIYCRSMDKCEGLAAELGCDFHHSGISEHERREAR
ncbi:hypothetical protein QBC37DRAFT_462571, partial [Rhypophila decipiens]